MTRIALILTLVFLVFAAAPARAQSSELRGSPIDPSPLRIVPAPSLAPAKPPSVAAPTGGERHGDITTKRHRKRP